MGRNEDPVLARLSRSRTGLNNRHNVVVPLLGNDNKINSDRRHKARQYARRCGEFAEVTWLEIGSE
jgi:hypothetical protein